MEPKGNENSEVECAFYLYFPQRLREIARLDGQFHGLLMPDAYAPRTRESALSRIEEDRMKLDGTPGWNMGLGYNYKVIKRFLENPESKPQVDFEGFARSLMRYWEEEDLDASLKTVLDFFDVYPLFQGFYGRVPVIEGRTIVTPRLLYCWNCFTVRNLDPETPGPIENCCEAPDLELVMNVTFENMASHELTKRRMAGYADFIRERLIAKIQGSVDLANLSIAYRRRLGYCTKEVTKRQRVSLDQRLQEIRDLARGYREEIRRAKKDPTHRSPFMEWLKERGLKLAYGTQELIEKWVEEELADLRTKYPKQRIPKIGTVLRGPRKKTR